VQLVSRPAGATVLVGDRVLGTTPLTLTRLPGALPIRAVVHHDGYLDRALRIYFDKSRTQRIDLEPDPLARRE
jgi:hypothetical protein